LSTRRSLAFPHDDARVVEVVEAVDVDRATSA
jgi:hypothetical protein